MSRWVYKEILDLPRVDVLAAKHDRVPVGAEFARGTTRHCQASVRINHHIS
jgi:hypothetical protein